MKANPCKTCEGVPHRPECFPITVVGSGHLLCAPEYALRLAAARRRRRSRRLWALAIFVAILAYAVAFQAVYRAAEREQLDFDNSQRAGFRPAQTTSIAPAALCVLRSGRFSPEGL